VRRQAGVVLGVLVVLTACQSSDNVGGARIFDEDAVSFVPPEGWDIHRDRDTLILVGSPHGPAARTTIAVRTAAADGWSEPRTLANVTASTARVLSALPGATVRGPVDFEHTVYRGKAFDVTWTPRKGGQRYQRRHVTLEANDHLYHVLHTAPEGDLDATKDTFARVIDTLREEG
jgi:hypothetical protein